MIHLWTNLLSVFGLGRSHLVVVTPAQFTHEFCLALRQHRPASRVMIVGDLEVTYAGVDGGEVHHHLHNAYWVYQKNPANKASIMEKLIQYGSESRSPKDPDELRSQIVPVVRSVQWIISARLEESRDGGVPAEPYYEVLNDELIVLYAVDSPLSISYVNLEVLAKAKIEPASLRALACANLRRLLPKIEYRGAGGSFTIIADGNYESSLLLLEGLWTNKEMVVQGDPVVAIPNRSTLFVTGSENALALASMREAAADDFQCLTYPISDKLFVYRQGKFEIFEG